MKKIITLLLVVFTTVSFSQDYKFGKVSKSELEEAFYPQDSSASAAYLYKSRRTYYDYYQSEGFKVITEVKERLKIYSKEGTNYGNVFVRFYKPDNGNEESIRSIKGYTFNLENGKVEKSKLTNNNIFDEKRSKYYTYKKIAMPNVKEGSVVDLRYEIVSPFIYSINDVKFQFNIPVKELNSRIEIPEWYTFNKRAKGYYTVKPKQLSKSEDLNYRYATGGFGQPKRRETSTTRYKVNIEEYNANNIPALRDDEPYIGNVDNFRGAIVYELASTKLPNSNYKFYSTTWKDVSKKIYANSNFGSELKKTGYFKKDIEALLQGVTSNEEKLVKIYQFVKSKVKWNDYYGKYTDNGVKKAYKEGVGNVADINLMLTAMLREAGLNANPVLTSTKNNGFPIFPTSKGFNYVISMVEFPNNTYALLDATESYAVPNILPYRVLNWQGRKVLKDGTSSWINLTPSNYAIEEHKIFAKVTEDDGLEGVLRTTYGNLNALNYRKVIGSLKNEEITTKLEEKYEIEIDDLKLKNQEDISKPIGRNIKFSSEASVEDIGGKKYITPLLFFAKTTNPFKLDDRKFPVDFIAPWKDEFTVSLSIPQGYTVEKVPEPMAIGMSNDLGFFKYNIVSAGNKIKIQAIIQINKPLIGVESYQELKEFYAQMVAKQTEKIILVK